MGLIEKSFSTTDNNSWLGGRRSSGAAVPAGAAPALIGGILLPLCPRGVTADSDRASKALHSPLLDCGGPAETTGCARRVRAPSDVMAWALAQCRAVVWAFSDMDQVTPQCQIVAFSLTSLNVMAAD
mmetsp:Transcript_2462/g.7396  ORF Transcript_2462/g.7396 Transcript_2462/m.7396 type:complete len:127 (+) Transcript_2462:880-1260(+)